MISAFILAAAIIAVGTELSERVRLRQEETILHKLPEAEAVAYYEVLKRRVRKIRLLKAIVLIAFVILMFAYKKLTMSPGGP